MARRVDRNPNSVGIVRGTGLIARFGNVVMYVADATVSARPLLAVAELAATAERPGAALAERLAALVFGADAAEFAPFGLLAPVSGGLLVMLRGTVTADIGTDGSSRTLSGVGVATWVDEILPDSLLRVAVTAGGGSDPSECPESDLRAGVVPGGGFVWLAASASTLPRQQSASPPAAPATQLKGMAPTEHRLPSAPTAAETPSLSGVAGFLAAQDGAVYPLDRPYVIGRDPLRDDTVRAETAAAITVQDPYVSRVHAYVWIDGGSVFVRDAATPGGTFVAIPGARDWTDIGRTPTELPPSGMLRIGEQILTYLEDRP